MSAEAAPLLGAYAHLRAAGDVEELFAVAAEAAPAATGFERAVVSWVRDGWLTTGGSRPIGHPPSDELRRLLLADPVMLRPNTEEAEHVRHLRRTRAGDRRRELARVLSLREHAFGVVAPQGAALALLVVDRASRAVDEDDTDRVDALAGLIGIALDRLLLRHRVADLAAEVRAFAGTARALAAEVRDAPVSLAPAGTVHGGLEPGAFAAGAAPVGDVVDVLARLSAKERPVAELLAEGRSNREIAQALTVSQETVKSHVASVLRKLGVANRVEAATLLLRAPR